MLEAALVAQVAVGEEPEAQVLILGEGEEEELEQRPEEVAAEEPKAWGQTPRAAEAVVQNAHSRQRWASTTTQRACGT